MAGIRLDSVIKFYGDGPAAVDDVSLDVDDGEFLVLVGPSGCGKSTLLRIIAGLEDVTAGEVWIGDRQVTDLPPKDRDIAMVFQNYALYPHMTVAENIGFGLRLRKTPKADRAAKIVDVARLLALDGLLDRKPGQLSGGQRQRVAMGRAMVREPLALLMDEPLSNLDAKLRVQMRAELNRLHTRLATTTVYVTHDQIEAMTLGDRVAVLRDGVLQQLDTPHALFHAPANLFVAAFIGSPSMNLLDAKVSMCEGRAVLAVAGQVVNAPPEVDLGDYVDGHVVLGVRPTDFAEAGTSATEGWPDVDITVDVVEELGTEMNVLFRLGSMEPTGRSTPIITINSELITAPAAVDLDAEFSDVLTATVGPRTRLRPGDRTRLAVDVTRMHLFDPLTGNALPPR